jgi:hypothetical protein
VHLTHIWQPQGVAVGERPQGIAARPD